MKHTLFRNVARVSLITVAVMVIGVGIAVAGTEFRQKAELVLMTGDAMGEVRLELERRDGMTELQAELRAEGLQPNRLFTFCLGSLEIDTEDSDDNGEVRLDEDMIDSPPDNLLGVVVTVWVGSVCGGRFVLQGTVMAGDIQQ